MKLGTLATQQTLATLVTQDVGTSGDKTLGKPWKGCEAVHL